MQGMLRHCREESREAIMDLRGGLLEKMDLPAALRKELPVLVEECRAKLEVTVTGEIRRFQAKAERHIFRIAKEAVTNAVRHASPSNIEVELHFRPKAFELLIEDDGIGFEVERLSKSERFGLQGMRERANRVQGLIEIKSSRGQGTLVRLELTSTVEWELKQG
ncbi:MAG: ATP-binding protein, partial [Verrucomicrobiota bacterium]